MSSQIVEAVESTIKDVMADFVAESTRFFTEFDLVCWFYSVLQQKLGPLASCNDKDGNPHNLVHCEYPTPFRCCMSNRSFMLKTDADRTPKGGKYKRGHYDIVVFNPDFVRALSFPEIRAQHYESFVLNVRPLFVVERPALLYGIEFHYKRNEKRNSNDAQPASQAKTFAEFVKQDTDKLRAGKSLPGFVQHIRTLAFAKGVKKRLASLIREKLAGQPDVLHAVVEH